MLPLPVPTCDPLLCNRMSPALFQSSLKRRGSREAYKEKKAFTQVSSISLSHDLKSVSVILKIAKESPPAQISELSPRASMG